MKLVKKITVLIETLDADTGLEDSYEDEETFAWLESVPDEHWEYLVHAQAETFMRRAVSEVFE